MTIGELETLLEHEIQQPLNEHRIYKDPKYNYSIAVDNDKGGKYRYLPYFKFCRGKDFSNAKEISRIPIKSDEDGRYKYQIHPKGKGKHFDLNEKEFDILDKMLKTEIFEGVTVWDSIIDKANTFISQFPDYQKWLIPIGISVPEYKVLLTR